MPYITASGTRDGYSSGWAWAGFIAILFCSGIGLFHQERSREMIVGVIFFASAFILPYIIVTSTALKWIETQEKVRDKLDSARFFFRSPMDYEKSIDHLLDEINKSEKDVRIYENLIKEWKKRKISWWRKALLKETRTSPSPWQMEYENACRLHEGLKALLREKST